jgi:geranylgeranyl reductase family protein
MKRTYDIIIAGGGPAGSTAGYLLSRSGFRVLLIDKSAFPRHKLCGGCITHKTVKLLERVFGVTADDLKKNGVINFESSRYEIFCKDKLLTKRDSPVPFYFIERYIYDNFLLRKAQSAGTEVIEGEKVASINMPGNKVITDSGKQYLTRFFIGADGINSIMRRHFPGEAFNRETWQLGHATALEAFISRSKIQRPVNNPALYFDFINYGYAWMFPNKDKVVVGLGGLTQKNKKQFLPSFNNFLSTLNIGKLTIDNIRGYAFPYGNFLQKPAFRNIILVGDAAGFADPLLGEGIYYAQRSAELASQAICETLKEDKNFNAMEKLIADNYLHLLREHIFPELIYAKKIRKFIFEYLNKYHYLPLKIMMELLGARPLEAVHGLRSYKWLRKKHISAEVHKR